LPPRRLTTTEIADPATCVDSDVASDEAETGPLRRCIVTRQRLPKEQMIRFVVGPDGRLVPDLGAKLPGRGMWLSASGDVLEFAGQEERAGDQKAAPESRGGRQGRQLVRAFAREARAPVVVPHDLGSLLQAALIQRTGELIGLARRAGQAVAGFEKAREHLRTTGARLVVQARDGSAAERTRFLSGAPPGTEVIDPLTGEELGRVFGRDYVVHVAIAPGRLADRLATEAARLAGIRTRSAET